MQYTILLLLCNFICSIPLCAQHTDRSAETNSHEKNNNEPPVYSSQEQQKAVHQDIATQAPAPSRPSQSQQPTHPLSAVEKTKEPPVDDSISYEKSQNMSLEQAYTARIYYLWKQQIDAAIRVIERILILEEDQTLRAQHMIEIGDLYMSKEDYPHAQAVYDTFAQLYPGSIYLEYVLHQSLLCHYYSIISPDKDQTATHNLIEACQNYLASFGDTGLYSQEARRMLEHGYAQLCKSELVTVDFYINKYTYTTYGSSLRSAYYRLQHIYHHIAPYMPSQQSHSVQKIIARALYNIAIDTLEEARESHKNHIYEQLCQIRQELRPIVDETTKSWWNINPLHRF